MDFKKLARYIVWVGIGLIAAGVLLYFNHPRSATGIAMGVVGIGVVILAGTIKLLAKD